MKKLFVRLTALCLCMCLLPLLAFAEHIYCDGTPVTRSDFELSFHLNADGFPDDGQMHYQDWETFLNKISLRGTVDAQSFPMPEDRVYFDGGLYVKDKLTIPFEYDGYYNFRYLRSPALGGASIYFQMFNFFQFMLKPYYYMTLPTQYAALLLYPEAAVELWNKYAGPMKETFGAETVSYDALYALCETLDAIVLEDDYEKTYYFFTSLLNDQGMDWTALEKLAAWENLLDHLDPEQQGMTVSEADGTETWTIGETTVFEKTVSENGALISVCLPDPDGYEFRAELEKTPDAARLQVLILLEGEEYLNVSVGVDGLPVEGETEAQGTAWAEVTGSVLYEEVAPLHLVWNCSRTAEEQPYDMALTVDLINSETNKPCLGFAVSAHVSEQPHTVLVDRDYDNQDDFFHLNESYIEEYKERFLPTLVLAAAPVVLELPAGVISDAIAYMEETGILAFVGIE